MEGDVATDYRYDRAGRLIERSAPNSKESFGYDPAGRLFQAKNRYASLRWVYDAVGNVTEEHHSYHVAGVKETYRWQHEHDKLGNRIATIRPDGHRVDVLNYGSGHIHGLLFGQRDIFNLERDKLHRETQRVLGNALQQTLAYDKAGRLSSQRLMGATQWNRQYQYDAAGQLTGIADNRSGQLNYRYDPVGRLLEAATLKGVESFRFDPAGNLLDNAPAADGHQNDSLLGNLLSQYAGRHYRYDSRGNLVEKRVNGSLTKLEWDSHNRLSRLTAPDGQRTDYHYDPLGRRIAKISQGEATLYGWDGDVLAFETRDTEAVHYLFEPDSFVPLAQVHTNAIRGVKVPAWSQHNPYDPDKDPLRQAGPEPQAPKAVYDYHTDHLGTPQALTDEQGAIALEMDYQAWGQAREEIADAASKAGIRNPFRFQGQYHDDESGLHYNRYRYYDPEIGRFISRDPIGLMGGINIHSYAPNPTEWVDPIGLSKKKANAGTKAVSCPCEQDDPCGSPTKVDWTSHGGKHVPSKNASWKDTVKSTKTGAAKYKPEVNIQALERSAWATGTPVSTGGKNTSWKVASMPDVIGASEGKETNLMRVECSQGVIHGHPISQTEYNKLTRR